MTLSTFFADIPFRIVCGRPGGPVSHIELLVGVFIRLPRRGVPRASFTFILPLNQHISQANLLLQDALAW
jgi:hypothetical protein